MLEQDYKCVLHRVKVIVEEAKAARLEVFFLRNKSAMRRGRFLLMSKQNRLERRRDLTKDKTLLSKTIPTKMLLPRREKRR